MIIAAASQGAAAPYPPPLRNAHDAPCLATLGFERDR